MHETSLSAPSRPVTLLLVEDEPLIASGIAQALDEAGFAAVRITYSLAEASRVVASEKFDGAILDVILSRNRVWPVASALRSNGTPFVLMTGLTHEGLHEEFLDAPVVYKPFRESELVRAVRRMLGPLHATTMA